MMRLRAVVWAENKECDDVEEGDRWVTGDVASGAFKVGDEWMSLDCFSRHTKRTSPVLGLSNDASKPSRRSRGT